MNRNLRIMMLVAVVAFASATASVAGSHQKKVAQRTARAQVAASAQSCDPSHCGMGARTAAAVQAKAATAATCIDPSACPVSDPSKCPVPCQGTASATTAVNVRH